MLENLPQKKEPHFCNSFFHYEPSRNSTGQACLSNQRPTDYLSHSGLPAVGRTLLEFRLKNLKQKKELHFCNSFIHYEPLAGIEPATYWLQVSCSTSWAKEAYLNGAANIEGLTYSSKSTPFIFLDSSYLTDSEDLKIKTPSELSVFSSVYRSPLPLSEFWHQTVLLTYLRSWKQQKSRDCFSKV